MHARRDIVAPQSYAHVTFRCLNREFLFEPTEVKEFIILTWAKYRERYGIKIFAFIVMDNHAHLMVQVPSDVELGHFMRTTNSQIARYVNYVHGRDSHALRERYKSPTISSSHYMKGCLQYIWLNRFKVNRSSDPTVDPYCSLSWAMNHDLLNRTFGKYKEASGLSNLLTSLAELPSPFSEAYRDLLAMVNDAINDIESLARSIYQHAHTIGDRLIVEFRGRALSATRKLYIPWVPI